MKVKNLLAVLIIAIVGFSTLNAQEMDHSKMKKDTTKMEMDHSKMEMKAMYTCPMHADVKSDKPGECPKCGMDLKKMEMKLSKKDMDHSKMEMKHDSSKMGMDHNKMAKEKMVKVYTCSMHPEITSDKPGDCPKCGMTLTEKKTKKEESHKNHKH